MACAQWPKSRHSGATRVQSHPVTGVPEAPPASTAARVSEVGVGSVAGARLTHSPSLAAAAATLRPRIQ